MATKTKSVSAVSVDPSVLEGLSASTKLMANKQTAIVRGWKAITPDVIAASRAADEARTDALTAHYMAKFS